MKFALPPMPMYILGPDNTPIKVTDTVEWAAWRDKNNPTLRFDQISKDVKVSTVFLGFDFNMFPSGRPLLWETMISGGPHHRYQERYSTYDDALSGHQKAVALAEGEIDAI